MEAVILSSLTKNIKLNTTGTQICLALRCLDLVCQIKYANILNIWIKFITSRQAVLFPMQKE